MLNLVNVLKKNRILNELLGYYCIACDKKFSNDDINSRQLKQIQSINLKCVSIPCYNCWRIFCVACTLREPNKMEKWKCIEIGKCFRKR